MTEAQLRGLRALDAAPNKTLPQQDFRRALGITNRSFYLVLHRMLEANLIARRANYDAMHVELTVSGLRAIAKAEGRS